MWGATLKGTQSEGRIGKFTEDVSGAASAREPGRTAGGLATQVQCASVIGESIEGCLTRSSLALQKLEFLQLSVQGGAIDLKYLSGLGHVPFRGLQGMHEGLLFGFLH